MVIKYKDSSVEDSSEGFIGFVARSGYKHELEIGENDKASPRRTTPIHHANKLGYYKIIPDLFKIYNRYDVNCVDESGLTHFYVACKFGCDDVVKKFLRFGQDPDCFWYKMKESPLDMSLDNNEDKNPRLQLRYEVDPKPFYSYRSTPLQNLLWNEDNFSSAELFLKISDELKKPSLINVWEDWGNRPLLLALDNENKKVAESLLKKGANPNVTNEKGTTPLHIVSMGEQCYDLAKMLFKICDDKHQPLLVNARDGFGDTPLHVALKNSSYGKKNVVELLLSHGADPNLTDRNGNTLLHIICAGRSNRYFVVEILFQVCRKINRTVQINARDKDGNTPLHLALEYPCEKVLDLLLQNGADPNSRNTKGFSPLHVICDGLRGDYALMKMFFKLCKKNNLRVQVNAQDEMGSPIDARDKLGRTPLQWAVASLMPKAVDILINNGADLSSFTFPDESHFNEMYHFTTDDPPYDGKFEHFPLRPASGALATIERLQERGYELDRSDVLKIMNIFANYGLFEKSTDVLKSLYDDKEFANEATEWMVKPDLSFYKFIQLQPKELEKLLTY
ncbi:ankyrin-1-like [Trichogramma pretiosum]|uniref:ankyrin-1-like n=1 Tax=Trichogramma pretiosum TaxID=7493 RepID=UPI000C71C45D|nr:ankyrin-1-like [Trichogramma pretiosum]